MLRIAFPRKEVGIIYSTYIDRGIHCTFKYISSLLKMFSNKLNKEKVLKVYISYCCVHYNSIFKIKTFFCNLQSHGCRTFFNISFWCESNGGYHVANVFIDEILNLFDEEKHPVADLFQDQVCVVKLSYLVDIFNKQNSLNFQPIYEQQSKHFLQKTR